MNNLGLPYHAPVRSGKLGSSHGPCYNPVSMLSDPPTNPEELLGPLKLTPQRRAWITSGVMLGLFLSALEATAVVTAMPTVISSLRGLEFYSRVYSIYFLTATVSIPLWGRLSDFYGRRLFYIAGIVFFVGGSVLCGLSQSMVQLVAFRAIQGLGAGALLPLGMTIVGDIYSLERRARMQGWFSGIWGLSSIIGPLLGGLITDHLSWRWVFFLNIPFGLLAGTIIALALVEPRNRRDSRVDYLGVLLLIVSLSLLLISLDQFKGGEPNPGQYLALITAGTLLALFIFQQRKPLIPFCLYTFLTIGFFPLPHSMVYSVAWPSSERFPLFPSLSRGCWAQGQQRPDGPSPR